MKKTVKAILGLSAAVAVLGGGLAALILTDPDRGSGNEDGDNTIETTVPEENKVVVMISDSKVTETDPDTGEKLHGVVKAVDIVNAEGEIHVIQSGKTDGVPEYTLKGYETAPLMTTVISTLANNVAGLTSEDVIEENCTNIGKFGLDKPAATVNITFETGSEYTLFLGSDAPNGTETYAMVMGDNTVYTVRNSAVLNYLKPVSEFINKTIYKSPDTLPTINLITIERKDLEEDIILEKLPSDDSTFSGGTSSVHIMRSPTEAYIDTQKADKVLSGLFGLYASEIYCLNCEEADIAETGLSDPFCRVTMKYADTDKMVLLISEPFDSDNGKSCYVMPEGGSIIYTIDAESVPWATVQPVDLASTIFVASYVWSVRDLCVKTGDKTYSFKVSPIDPANDLVSTKTEDYKAELNGKEVETERYRKLYSFLLNARAETFALDETPSGEPLVSVSFTDSYNKKDFDIRFYDYSNLKALVTIGGQSKFIISKSYVQTLIDNAARVDSDEEFVTTWK